MPTPEAYGRWWQITKNEYYNCKPFCSTPNVRNEPNAKHTKSNRKSVPGQAEINTVINEDHITSKLREIRNQSRTNATTSKVRETIEKSVEKLVKQGLTITEAVEYEANQTRLNQLQAKMNCEPRKNQYENIKSNNHV